MKSIDLVGANNVQDDIFLGDDGITAFETW